MADLAQLEQDFEDAKNAYREDRSDENRKRYEETKAAFAQARSDQRRAEEEDPNHSRGDKLVTVTDEENGE